jgi:hypothetical protein
LKYNENLKGKNGEKFIKGGDVEIEKTEKMESIYV